MRKVLFLALGLFFLSGTLVFAAGAKEESDQGALSEKPVTLRMGLISSENDPVTVASRRFAELVKEKSGGAYEVQVIPGGSLGGEIEMHDMIAVGNLDIGCFGSGVPSSYNPEFQILLMPFLWDNPEQMISFSKSKFQEEMNAKYTEKSDVRILASNWDMGLRHTISTRPIKSLEDFKGLRVRVPQLPAWVEMFSLLGAAPTALGFPEVYSALQQGVVDAAESPLGLMYSTSWHEPAKYLVLTSHIMYFNMVYINDNLFQSLSADLQKVFIDAALEAGDYMTEITRNNEADVRAKLKESGVTFVEVDIAEISSRMAPLFDTWEKEFGSEIRKKVEAFKASNP